MTETGGEMDYLTPEIEAHIEELKERLRKTPYGDVGLVFTMSGGQVTLIKPINLPVIRPGKNHGKS